MKRFLLGNEAIALGAIQAGISVAAGCQGPPSTEILKAITGELPDKPAGCHVEWAVNEKTALEIAAGAAFASKRALVVMGQAGLIPASEVLMSLTKAGITGGLVVIAPDNVDSFSFRTVPDTRHFAQYAKLPVYDPSTTEEAFLMTTDAFAYSEKSGRPVLIRPTARIYNSYASVDLEKMETTLAKLKETLSSYRGNSVVVTPDSPGQKGKDSLQNFLGIAAGGISYSYIMDILKPLPPRLKLLKAGIYPFPDDLALNFLEGLDEVLVLEELDPVLEDQLLRLCGDKHLRAEVRGKRTRDMPRLGEYTPDLIADHVETFLERKVWVNISNLPEFSAETINSLPVPAAVADDFETQAEVLPKPPRLPLRRPVICENCPRRKSFLAIKEALGKFAKDRKVSFSGSLDCPQLGYNQGLEKLDAGICAGSGIAIAQGMGCIEQGELNFAFVGDAPFFHSGINALFNAAQKGSDIIVVILDSNTGVVKKTDIGALAAAMGITEIARVNPGDAGQAEAAVAAAIGKTGVRIIIFEGPCLAAKGNMP